METIIGDYVGTTLGIHCPIPYEEPDRSLLKLTYGSQEFSYYELEGLKAATRVEP